MIDIHSIKSAKELEKLVEEALGRKVFPIEKKWVSGGVVRGWTGTESRIPAEAEPLHDPEEWIDVLEVICPDITFLQYKRLESRGLWDEYTDSKNDYYECEEYKIKRLNTQNLLDALKSVFR
ncbi:hypothetical protein [Serratia sp. Se-RSBMAAmG]|uniref:hypothetical protein n=1 Tax=Serratia sp. Se-RSBMAAmG TaxID=3043305 RepID=UPI0024AE9DED|nr:hypothetical protein [Serratia sp. Se-RSBMAAmG]MDI6975952.1 hypothetical protein [Serratia sp. Se-RSBMAAmG]